MVETLEVLLTIIQFLTMYIYLFINEAENSASNYYKLTPMELNRSRKYNDKYLFTFPT